MACFLFFFPTFFSRGLLNERSFWSSMGSWSGASPFWIILSTTNVSATVWQVPGSAGVDGFFFFFYLLRCSWSHLDIEGIMPTRGACCHAGTRLCEPILWSPLGLQYPPVLMSYWGSSTLNTEHFGVTSPRNRPRAWDWSACGFLRIPRRNW